MDRIIKCYTATSHVALMAEPTNPSTWREMHTHLPNLRKHLTCQICFKLVDSLNPYNDAYACTKCVNYKTKENLNMTIVQCYKRLCILIYNLPIYDVMCSRLEDRKLVQLVNEVVNEHRPKNGQKRGMVNGTGIKHEPIELNNFIETNPPFHVKLPTENKISNEHANLQVFDVQNQKHQTQQSVVNDVPKKKRNERRWGCRCGNATTTPGKLTCFGQRCPCYTEQKSCDRCKCRGCRNPRRKQSNNDNNPEIDQIRRKPVTLELVSSLQPSHIIDSKQTFGSYAMHEVLQFPSHSRNYDQNGTEVTLGHVNSIFHSP